MSSRKMDFIQIELCYMNGLLSLQKKNTVIGLTLLSPTLYISASPKVNITNLNYEVSTEYITFFASRSSIAVETMGMCNFLSI